MPVTTNYDHVGNLAFFLLAKTGTILGTWRGRLTAKQQRDLFGRFLGKGILIINGSEETLRHRVKVAFGLDWDDTVVLRWNEV